MPEGEKDVEEEVVKLKIAETGVVKTGAAQKGFKNYMRIVE